MFFHVYKINLCNLKKYNIFYKKLYEMLKNKLIKVYISLSLKEIHSRLLLPAPLHFSSCTPTIF